MTKLFRLLLPALLLLPFLPGMGQSYYFIFQEGTRAPYDYKQQDLNVDLLTSGNDVLSPWTQLPFAWDFYGQTVNGYYASDNGYITFDQNAMTSYPINSSVPSFLGPNNAIYALWDDFEVGVGSRVRAWEYGVTPGRVYCIQWENVKRVGTSTSVTMTIRLYEGGDFDIIWDEVQGSSASLDGTIGCENASGTGGYQLQSAPSTQIPALSSSINDDHVYAFHYGNQQQWDLSVITTNMRPSITTGTYDLRGVVKNLGSNSVTSFQLNYQLDNGPINTIPGNTLSLVANGGTWDFYAGAALSFPTAGQFYTLRIWPSSLNGNNDQNNDNDTLTVDLVTMLGNSVPKNVLLETFQGTSCACTAYGMDDAEAVGNAYPNTVFPVQIHLVGSSTLNYSTYLNSFFDVTGLPMGMVDRAGRNTGNNPVVPSADWSQDVANRLNETTPASVELYNTFDPVTRQVNGQAVARFEDYALGDMRFVVYVVEDDVPWYSRSLDGLVRDMPLGEFGNAGAIPTQAGPGDVFIEEFSFTIDPNLDISKVRLVGFLARYDDNYFRNEVINVNAAPLGNGVAVADAVGQSRSLGVAPNPSNGLAAITVEFDKPAEASFRLVNLQGQVVRDIKQGRFSAGQHRVWFDSSSLPAGLYYLQVDSDRGSFAEKVLVAK